MPDKKTRGLNLGKCLYLRGNGERRMDEGIKKKLSGKEKKKNSIETKRGNFHGGGEITQCPMLKKPDDLVESHRCVKLH